jgi:hypothetical protein
VGGPPAWGSGGGLTTLPRKTRYLLRITTHSLGTGRITWHNLSTGKWTRDLVHGMLGAFIGQVHLKRWVYRRSDGTRTALNGQRIIHSCMERGMKIISKGQVFCA